MRANEIRYSELPGEYKHLLYEAEQAMHGAYNPYSKFFVGAALLTRDGKIVSGSNVENASYGGTICAERAALCRANAEGHRVFVAFAVIARGENFDTQEATAPCGFCRQLLYEARQVSEENLTAVLSTTKKDKIIITTIDDLLPLAFGPKDLGIDVRKYQK